MITAVNNNGNNNNNHHSGRKIMAAGVREEIKEEIALKTNSHVSVAFLFLLIEIAYFAETKKFLDTSSVIFVMVVSILVTASIMYIILTRMKVTSENQSLKKTPGVTMQLQAYERLLILVDRIALPHLISRVNQPHATSREMQLLLTQNIRSEFDYNITQQIYVSPDAWNAVKNLKEQNLLIINQLANVLPPNATGLDLNKLLLEFLMSDKKGTLHEVVSEALSYEAKKLME